MLKEMLEETEDGGRLAHKMELRPDGRRKTNEKLVWMVWKG